jgi:hypothetical protein
MKVIIAGGRDFNNGQSVIYAVSKFEKEVGLITEIVCGMAEGADMMGFNYATMWGIPVKEFPADWNKYKKAAGPIRNKQMADYADALIAFWNGNSKGTMNMIVEATNRGLKVYVFRY